MTTRFKTRKQLSRAVQVTDKPCGDPHCCSSTGEFRGEITFGHGRLNDMGYWSKPCRPCAEKWDSEHADAVAAVGDSMLAQGYTLEQVIEYVQSADWLNTPAWPYS